MRLIKICLLLLLAATCSVQPLLANSTAEPMKRLLVLGDSLTAGHGLAAGETFPEQLERALQQAGHNVTVINAGVSGDTTAGGLARLDWALRDDPQLVIVELGGNDALRGLPPEETFANLDAILERLDTAGVCIILTGMQAPRNLGVDYTTAFNQIYTRLASKHKVSFYPFFLDGVALDPALNQADGIHPNSAGVGVIVDRMLPVLVSVLETVNK
ncbi:MAG: arylesterase [Desulfuromonadales bacterium]|nr:arylesterase [Desulfuromonadales bacterium]